MKIYNYVETEYKDGTQCKVYDRAYKRGDETQKKPKKRKPPVKSHFEALYKNIPLTLQEKLQVDEIEKSENSILYQLSKDHITTKSDQKSIINSTNRTINKIYEIARSNTWEWMITLTFDPEQINRYDYDEITTKLKKWINNIKHNYAPNLKYLIVPELHKDCAYHFHGLLSNTGRLTFLNSEKKQRKDNGEVMLDQNGNPIYIYNLIQYYLGFTNCTKIRDNGKAVSYITKYITKELTALTIGKKRYWHSNNLEKPIIRRFYYDPEETENIKNILMETAKSVKTVDIKNLSGGSNEELLQRITYIEMD